MRKARDLKHICLAPQEVTCLRWLSLPMRSPARLRSYAGGGRVGVEAADCTQRLLSPAGTQREPWEARSLHFPRAYIEVRIDRKKPADISMLTTY